MKTFRDNKGKEWLIAINVSAIKRVRALLKIDLYKLIDDDLKPLGEFIADPYRLVDVLYVLCKEEADKSNITDEDFGRALGGDSITHAAEAFVEELIDFFPDARMRAGVRKVIAKGRKVRDQLLDHAEKTLEAVDPDLEATKLIESSGKRRAASASTPDPLPSTNS